MTITVAHWTGSGVEVRPWGDHSWHGVLWVTILTGDHRHTLLGADRYWVDGGRYGMEYDKEGPVAFGVTADGPIPLGALPAPDGVMTLAGFALPDGEWQHVLQQYGVV